MLHSGGRPQDLELPVKIEQTNDYMIQKVKQTEYKKNPNPHKLTTQLKANSVCYMFLKNGIVSNMISEACQVAKTANWDTYTYSLILKI